MRGVGAGSSQSSASDEALQALTTQMSEMRVSVEALEKERDFYFGKLREIEIIVAARLEEPEEGVAEADVLARVQEILYQTEVSPSTCQYGRGRPLIFHAGVSRMASRYRMRKTVWSTRRRRSERVSCP